jgi:hypothetical protein
MMENSPLSELLKKRANLLFALCALLLLGGVIYVTNSQTSTNAPIIEDEEVNPELAQIFNSDQFLQVIEESEENYLLTQKDLGTFARTTGEYYRGNTNPIAFTFNDGVEQNENNYIFTGSYYQLDGTIRLVVTKFDKGIIRLSITNEATETNIDNSLNLNGVKNNLLTQLPVEQDYYSIRYLYSSDKIVVAFYEGFSETQVNEVVGILQQAYGDQYDPSLFEFNINSVGLFTLDGVYNYLQNPVAP